MEMLLRRLALAVGSRLRPRRHAGAGIRAAISPAPRRRGRRAVARGRDVRRRGARRGPDARRRRFGGWRPIPTRSPASAAATWPTTRRGSPICRTRWPPSPKARRCSGCSFIAGKFRPDDGAPRLERFPARRADDGRGVHNRRRGLGARLAGDAPDAVAGAAAGGQAARKRHGGVVSATTPAVRDSLAARDPHLHHSRRPPRSCRRWRGRCSTAGWSRAFPARTRSRSPRRSSTCRRSAPPAPSGRRWSPPAGGRAWRCRASCRSAPSPRRKTTRPRSPRARSTSRPRSASSNGA